MPGKCHSTEGDRPAPSRYPDSFVDSRMGIRTGSRPMQPLGDRTVTLVERRHVDLVRVASAICRCSA
ncbi:putative leader peptide [Streptomyces sp. NPDC048270]|uniref:putative leader peptide n=1 Tax=Streptomyces sp. NPDC048270 TaxID=3154615 RepID=UPI0033FBE202